MAAIYDEYYQTENLFGAPYPELISFLSNYPTRGKLLDIGCSQGRDAIPIARLGFDVTGIDNSKVGIEQMKKLSQCDGKVVSIYCQPTKLIKLS